MPVTLTVTEGPHTGRTFTFDRHDTFLVGRTEDCHFRFGYDDPYFSRRHFLIEVNPPRCRVMDLKSRNGIQVNGQRVDVADLKDSDEVRAGHTVFRVAVTWPAEPGIPSTLVEPRPPSAATVDYTPPAVTVPGFRLEREIGRGCMGVVYRAVRDADGLVVALKTIAPAPGVPAKQVARFLREAEVLAQLKHPNIVGLVEAGQAGELVYLAMEHLTGPDAARVLTERGRQKPRTAVRLISQVLTGLQHAHEQGFVHRDIKPSNILLHSVGDKRMAKLADFGLARAFESSRMSGITMQGEVGGTPAFMAPEQVTHYRDVLPAADQYSVAATLYNLLTDRYPYELPKNVGQQLVMILTEPPVPIRDRDAGINSGLAGVVHKAMSREPNERFPDAAAFRRALQPHA
jgi:serine/threonine protein kinase